MSEIVKNKRDQIKDCIEAGEMTKAEIAVKLDMSEASVATQMTYLRWMDNYILTDKETKILSFTDKETFEKLEAEKKANHKTKSTSNRTPAERANAVAKTLGNQNKSLISWQKKLDLNNEVLEDHPDDADVLLNIKEATAQVALLEVKINRNEALAATLPEPVEEVVEEVEAVEEADVEEEEETAELL